MNENLKEMIDGIEKNFQKYPVTCFSLLFNMSKNFKDDPDITKELEDLKERISNQKEFENE